MNFFEAMEELKAGKVVQSVFGDRYQLIDGKIAYMNRIGPVNFTPRELSGDWSIVEPEKKKVKKWMWAYRYTDGVWCVHNRLSSEEEAARAGFKEYQKYGEPIEVEG